MAILQTKHILKISQSVAAIEGALFDTFLGEASLQETTHMSEQTLAYATRTKADGKGHGLGPPHIWAYSGLLISLGKRRYSVGARNAETLGKLEAEYKDLNVDQRCEVIRYCRLSKTHPQTGATPMKRLTLCFPPHAREAREAILASLVQAGWEKKQGRAPRIFMERELQEWLETLA